jgi:thioredoxin reductase
MQADAERDTIDVAIVGGGPAGMSAALVLGRMRRRVVVFDTEAPANSVSHGVGGLLTRDGTPPAELRAIGREQIAKYPTVEFRRDEVTDARSAGEGFELDVGGETVAARKLLLAHGLDYARPDVPGVEDLWGELAFHCPYCHGWEVRDRRVAVIATNPRAAHQALLLASLSDSVTVVGDAELEEDDRARLGRAGIEHVTVRVERVERAGSSVRIELAGREPLECDAIFIQPDLRLASGLAERLGAELTEQGLVETEMGGATSIPGLHVAGDAAAAPQSVAVAIGSGSAAGAIINMALAQEDAGADQAE